MPYRELSFFLDNNGLKSAFLVAHLWQLKGWQVVPVQPNSKRLVATFGIYQNKVEAGVKVSFWFQEREVNLAVVAPPDDGVILDFDQVEVYNQFCDRWPELAASYTESTPRGGRHLFLRTSAPIPAGVVLTRGIEFKQLVLVYPSKIEGKYYQVTVPGEILLGNVQEALQPFIAEEGDKLPIPPKVRRVGSPVGNYWHENESLGWIAELKARWPILDYLRYFEPKLVLRGRGRWWVGRCPWHDDHKPSLWVDTSRNLWGCHGCGAHGDILNWHARHLQTLMRGAVHDLARYRVEVQG